MTYLLTITLAPSSISSQIPHTLFDIIDRKKKNKLIESHGKSTPNKMLFSENKINQQNKTPHFHMYGKYIIKQSFQLLLSYRQFSTNTEQKRERESSRIIEIVNWSKIS